MADHVPSRENGELTDCELNFVARRGIIYAMAVYEIRHLRTALAEAEASRRRWEGEALLFGAENVELMAQLAGAATYAADAARWRGLVELATGDPSISFGHDGRVWVVECSWADLGRGATLAEAIDKAIAAGRDNG